MYDVIAEASKISESITPASDVYITCGRKIIDPRAPLCAQEVVEGSVLRIHYHLRGGAPGSGRQPECYSLVKGDANMEVGANFIMSTEVVVAEFVGPMIIVGSNAYAMGWSI